MLKGTNPNSSDFRQGDKTLITKQLMPLNQECSTDKTKQEDLGDKLGIITRSDSSVG